MKDKLRRLLEQVRKGELPIEKALQELSFLPYQELGEIRFDSHRPLRGGIPEVVYCPGKEPSQVVNLARDLISRRQDFIATRVDPDLAAELTALDPAICHHPKAKMATLVHHPPKPVGLIGVLAAGSSDIPVAEEARVTAETLGSRAEAVYDVGVAGLHRLLAAKDLLTEARVLVVAAGMEGALASVVAGLVGGPVIAVPTSVGYGASFGGIAPLLTMLNACAPGVTVVNIDNGFGAGVTAHLINRLGES